jgi:hypothetical protein
MTTDLMSRTLASVPVSPEISNQLLDTEAHL